MDITRDIRPLTEFKRNTTRFISRLRETGRPSVLTVNGKPALVVMDAEAWQDLQNRIEHARTVAAIGNSTRRETGRAGGGGLLREARRGRGVRRYRARPPARTAICVS